jgi:hypothetical protein
MVGSALYLGAFGRHRKYTERSLASMDRQEQLLERIAVALERRNGRD